MDGTAEHFDGQALNIINVQGLKPLWQVLQNIININRGHVMQDEVLQFFLRYALHGEFLNLSAMESEL